LECGKDLTGRSLLGLLPASWLPSSGCALLFSFRTLSASSTSGVLRPGLSLPFPLSAFQSHLLGACLLLSHCPALCTSFTRWLLGLRILWPGVLIARLPGDPFCAQRWCHTSEGLEQCPAVQGGPAVPRERDVCPVGFFLLGEGSSTQQGDPGVQSLPA
jgi:hypothetical protein